MAPIIASFAVGGIAVAVDTDLSRGNQSPGEQPHGRQHLGKQGDTGEEYDRQHYGNRYELGSTRQPFGRRP
jgi:hypothetical protein